MSKRTNLNALLFMLVFLLAMVGTTLAEPLFPFQVGQQYEFHKWDSDDPVNEWAVHVEVKSQVTIDSVNYFHVRQWNYDNDSALDDLYLRSTEDKVYLYGPPDNLEWQAAPVGTKWIFYQEEHGFYYKVIEIVAIEPVTVPYGTFTPAYKHRKYQCEFSDGLGNKSPYWYEWIVPGVGSVKEVDYWIDNPPAIMELVSVTAGLDIKWIYMGASKDYLDGTAISNPWFFMAVIDFVDPGTLHHIDVTPPAGGTPFTIYEDYGYWEYRLPSWYSTLTALQADYPPGNYKFEFCNSSNTVLRTVNLDYSGISEPGSPVDFTYPSYNGQTGISTNPTFTWTIDSGAGDALAMWVDYYDYDEIIENGPVLMDVLSWQPGPLDPDQNHRLAVDVFRVKDWAGGPGWPTKTVGGDEFAYILDLNYHNDIEFTTGPTVEEALDIERISMCSQKDHLDGTAVSSNPWRFEVDIHLVDTGSLANIDMTLPGGSTTYPLDNENGSWRYESWPTSYLTLTALRAIYPTGLYTFDFRDSSGSLIKSVQLDYSGIEEPGSPVDFTYPSYNGQTDISTYPIFTWNVNSEAGHGLGMSLGDDYEEIYGWSTSPSLFTMETLSWQPGPLDPEQNYWLYVSVVRVKDWAGGPGFPTKIVGGDEFEYLLHIGYCNKIGFTTNSTARPHPADKDSDYVIGDFELLDYIDLWAQGQVGDFELLDTIDLWAAGHY